ncbi:MAG: PAS domain-containing protein [Oligosphaeraceae bacterium]|nr:PAS domain-containing protein [Oligosphaeraceae bacterium]
MKQRDSLLFSLPLTAAMLIIVFAVFLYWQLSKFETSYINEAKKTIAREAELAAAVISPMLAKQDVSSVVHFCRTIGHYALRLTVIDSNGTVLADSKDDPLIFDNHKERQEVKSALEGKAASAVRYSSSMNQKMIYHAMPLDCNGKRYVMRSAIPTAEVGRIIDMSRLNMFWALLLGAQIVLFLTYYILQKVRKPLINLHTSVEDIASGNLDRNIDIPEDGIMRELAIDISEMTNQLKRQLDIVTAERNERAVLFDTMNEGVLLLAEDGNLIRANNAAARLLNFDKDKPFQLNRCHIPELVEKAMETLKSGLSFEKEFCLERNKTRSFLFIKGSVLRNNNTRRLLLTITDLSNMRKLESFRTDFVANVSHEIKTPLTCITGAAEALEENISPETQTRLIAMIKKHSERLNHIVRDILSLSQIEKSRRHESDMLRIRLDIILENVVNIERERAKECGFEIKITENLPLTVSGDADLLEQALINLIENALRYSNGKTVSVSVTQENANAVLTVRDDGIGIAEEHRDRLFERFYRVDKSRSRELGGTGLGLAIVKHIALTHNGKVEVITDVGKGAEFRIILAL